MAFVMKQNKEVRSIKGANTNISGKTRNKTKKKKDEKKEEGQKKKKEQRREKEREREIYMYYSKENGPTCSSRSIFIRPERFRSV